MVEFEVGGQELRAEVDYSPGTPDVMYLSNGDPGYPGDPEEFEVTKVEMRVAAGHSPSAWIDITDLVMECAQDEGEFIEEKAYEAFLRLAEEEEGPE